MLHLYTSQYTAVNQAGYGRYSRVGVRVRAAWLVGICKRVSTLVTVFVEGVSSGARLGSLMMS